MKELQYMPKWLGRPMYPGGFPVPKESISVNGITVQDMYWKMVEDKTTKYDEILKEYVIYHINAPLFDSEFTGELRATDFEKMSLEEVIKECMEYGLDPF